MAQIYKGRPPRLKQVFQSDGWPLYFVTFNALGRQPILACDVVHDAWVAYTEKGVGFGVGVGRYVVMPDHIHAFVRIGPEMRLKRWSAGVKRALGIALKSAGVRPYCCAESGLKSYWQPVFFDRLLRHDDSYAQKWGYVHENPVRAGLVDCSDDWLYQGEIVLIDRA